MFEPDAGAVAKAIQRRSFCVLATVSPAGRSHAAGVLYALSGGRLYVTTLRTSRKAQNVVANAHVGVFIPIRRAPVGPPSSVMFQAEAEILDIDNADIASRLQAGELKSITSHGELDLPDACFVRITPPARINTYGLGMSLWRLIRDPVNTAGVTEFVS